MVFDHFVLKSNQNEEVLGSNRLSVVFFILFVIRLVGQIFTGLSAYNQEPVEIGGQALNRFGIFRLYFPGGEACMITIKNKR